MTEAETMPVVVKWSACLNFFPKNPIFEAECAKMLIGMIGDKDKTCRGKVLTPADRLEWITKAVISLGKWPEDGLAAVRAIYGRFWTPADGIEGYTDSDLVASVPAPAPAIPEERPYQPTPEERAEYSAWARETAAKMQAVIDAKRVKQ